MDGKYIFFALIILTTLKTSSEYSLASGLQAYGFGGSGFGSVATGIAVKEAYAKYLSGEEGAFKDLMMNIFTLSACDVGGLAASSIIPYWEGLVEKKLLQHTTAAVNEYNAKLVDSANDLLRVTQQSNPSLDAIQFKIQNADSEFALAKKAKELKFKADLKYLKTNKFGIYKTLKANTKWLRFGGKVLKGFGPLLDIISIGVNIYSLTQSEPGTNEFTSAALGLAGGIVGVAGFLAGLALVAFPPAALVVGIVATVASISLGVASAAVGLMEDEELKKIAAAVEVDVLAINSYNNVIEQYPENMTRFMDKVKYYKWEFVYYLNQVNFVNWETSTGGIQVNQSPAEVKFGTGSKNDPTVDNKNRRGATCLPYKGKLYTNGKKQVANAVINPTCSNSRAKKTIGYDFVGMKNEFVGKPQGFQGYSIFCMTDAVKGKHYKYRGVKIETDNSNFGHVGDDFILLDNMKGMDGQITVTTGEGNDALSITSHLADYSLDVDLGSGYNVLSFASMPLTVGKKKVDINPIFDNKQIMTGIAFRINSGTLAYEFAIKGRKRSNGYLYQNLGVVKGVSLVFASPFDDQFHLDTTTKDDTDGIETFGIINNEGRNTYYLTLRDNEKNGFIRQYIIMDRSKDSRRPLIVISYDGSGGTERVVFKRDKGLVVYCKVNGKIRVYASFLLLEFDSSFTLKFKNRYLRPSQLGAIYSSGVVITHKIADETSDGFTDDDDQVIISCKNPTGINGVTTNLDLKGGIDYVVLGRQFLENCQINPNQELDNDEDIKDAVSSEMTVEKTLYDYHIKVRKSNGQTKDIRVKNAERIIDDFGTTIVDLVHMGFAEKIDLMVKYSESFGYDLLALEKSLLLTGASGLTIHPEDKLNRQRFGFEILFKPDKNGIIMFAQKNNDFIEIVINSDDNIVIVTGTGTGIRLKGKVVWGAWNTIKVTSNVGELKGSLNDNSESTWYGKKDWLFDNVHLGYYNINFSRLGITDRIRSIIHGFVGEILQFKFNDEEVDFRGKGVTYDHIAKYDDDNIENLIRNSREKTGKDK